MKKDRENIKQVVKDANFVEVYVNTPLEECERRDVKGLYKKARAGEIANFTGIDAPYEAPVQPHIEIETKNFTVDEAVEKIMNYLNQKLILK